MRAFFLYASHSGWITLMLAVLFTVPLAAQSDEARALERERVAESVEDVADHLSREAEALGESLEQWVEENSEEMEAWAEKYSEQWESWAGQFERRFERWAADQEQVWDDWARQYSHRWEQWADQLENESVEPQELTRIIQHNLEMLGDMPLGQMLEGLLSEGAEGLESAPWASLHELQAMMQDSIEESVADAERKLARSQREQKLRTRPSEHGEIEDETEFILPVIENQQEGLKSKEKILAREAQAALKKIERRLAEGNIDAAELQAMMEEMVRESERAKRDLDRRGAREVAEARRQRAEQERERAKRARRQAERAQAEAEVRRNNAEKNLMRALELARDDAQEEESNRDALLRVFRALEAEERNIQAKNEELETLRREIKQLRREVEKLKSHKDRKDGDSLILF